MPRKLKSKPVKAEEVPQAPEETQVQPEEVVSTPEPIVQPEVLPSGVTRKEVVEINGRRYNRYWKDDGTTEVELIE